MTDAEKIEELSRRLMEGETLRAAGKAVFGDLRALHRATSKDRALDRALDQAMSMRCDVLADEIIHIADTEPDPQKAKNQISARQWYASKLMPRKYGDRLELSVQHAISIVDALADARGRLLSSPLEQIQDAEVIDLPSLPASTANSSAGFGDRHPDIFS